MKKHIIWLGAIAAIASLAIGGNPRYIEELRIGGGYGESFDGGADFEQNGNITTNGRLVVRGDIECGTDDNADHTLSLTTGSNHAARLNLFKSGPLDGGSVWFDGVAGALSAGTFDNSAEPIEAFCINQGSPDIKLRGDLYFGDDKDAVFGTDADFRLLYSFAGNRLEWSDNNGNVLMHLADTGASGILSVGSIGIGTASPNKSLDIVGTDYNQLNLARYKTTGVQRTAISAQHYDAAEEPVCLFLGYSPNGENRLYFGGGSVLMNCATSIGFFTAANSTSVSGLERMTVGSDGNVTFNYDIDLKGGDINNSAGTTVSINEDLLTGIYEATDHSISVRSGAANDSYLNFYEADANNGGVMWYDGGDEALYIGTRNASATPTWAIKVPDGTGNVTLNGGITTSGSWDNNGENVYLGSHGASFEGLRINVVNSTGECFLLPEDDDDGLVFGIKPQTANNGDAEIAFFPSGTAINGSGLGKFIVYDPGTTTEMFKVMADTGDTTVGGDITVSGGDVVAGTDSTTRGTLTLWDGSGGNQPSYIKMHSPNGTAWYLFVEDDGTLKVHNAVPTQNSDGTAAGSQS